MRAWSGCRSWAGRTRRSSPPISTGSSGRSSSARIRSSPAGIGSGYGRHPRLPYPTSTSFAGVIDIALWDLIGKAAGLPIHALLGGAARTEIPLYWSVGAGFDKTPEKMVADVRSGGTRASRLQDPDGLGADPLRRRPGQGPRDGAPGPGGARAGRLARVRCQPRLLRGHGDPPGPRARAAGPRPFRGAAPRARPGRPARGLPRARHPGLDRRAAQASLALPRPHRRRGPRHPPARHRRRGRDQRGRPDLPACRGLRQAGHAPQPVGRHPLDREHARVLDGAVGGSATRVLGRVRACAREDRGAVRGAGAPRARRLPPVGPAGARSDPERSRVRGALPA